ncbi:flagellar MS-ring protein [Sodalis-like endosymbiont of Proechinophthirus fluctus]|uniref:flagellar basal-body MS-ring/collar protein FliF n=1 Tax=Sodalis-like endosymbiont of Proechinophthirus fluctus TaxID=1462730 RepID=UPI0007A933CC|nr:flagellar basal-body MS-ring/collar protein FliF [Sodalis-like endosymbiont of Proechinophthirus fluctus]KYP96947.1 flagellar MS-ring protein [Sodalis-like endosymbiont of Proechinophthirus fluctus]
MNASAMDIDAKSTISLTNIIARFRCHPKYVLLAASAAGIALAIVLLLWARTPDYRILYSNISDQDGGAVVAELTTMNIPYRFADNSGAIMVPSNRVHETRLLLARKGLPKGGTLGFELLDREKFGMSQFSEQINYQRALEGEIARTIETLNPVKSARVHIAMPKPSLFVRGHKPVTASVTLTLYPGRTLDAGQIQAITWLVSGTVPDLPAGNITLVDSQGQLLAQPGNNELNLSKAQLAYTREVESDYQRRINAILAPVIGAANVRAEVTAQLDFTTVEQTAEQHKPNGRPEEMAIRSQQLSASDQIGIQAPGGVPGALSNQPTPPAIAPIESSTNPAAGKDSAQAPTPSGSPIVQQPRSSQNDKTINYEVDRTLTHSRFRPGVLKRLSVAVVVNDREDGTGKPVRLTPQEMQDVTSLVHEAMGFSRERGDTLNIVNTRFVTNQDMLPPPFWQDPGLQAMAFSTLRYVLVALLFWLAWRKGFRPLWQRQQEIERERIRAQYEANQPRDEPCPVSRSDLEKEAREKACQAMEDSIQKLREIAAARPQMVARILRQWITREQQPS